MGRKIGAVTIEDGKLARVLIGELMYEGNDTIEIKEPHKLLRHYNWEQAQIEDDTMFRKIDHKAYTVYKEELFPCYKLPLIRRWRDG